MVDCDALCGNCDGPGDHQCVSCKKERILEGNACKCKEGTFHSELYCIRRRKAYFILILISIIACDPTCKACSGPLALDCEKDKCSENHIYEADKGCVCRSWETNDGNSPFCRSKTLIHFTFRFSSEEVLC